MADYYLNSVSGNDANNGTSRALAEATLTALLGDLSTAGGDRGFVHSEHTESLGASTTYTFPGTPNNLSQIICVDFAGTADPNPPVSADLRTSALVTVAANASITLDGFAYIRGMNFTVGTGSSQGSANFNVAVNGSQAHYLVFDTCTLRINSTHSGVDFFFGNTATNITSSTIMLMNTNIVMGHNLQNIRLRSCNLFWYRGTVTGSPIGGLFHFDTDTGGFAYIRGVNFSNVSSGPLVDIGTGSHIQYIIDFVECRFSGSTVVVSGSATSPGKIVRVWNCDSGDTRYRHEEYQYAGYAFTATDVVRSETTAQVDGIRFSRRITTASVSYLAPYRPTFDGPMAIHRFFPTVGTRTFTVFFIHGQSTVLNNSEIWLELFYPGASDSPLATLAMNEPADILAPATNHPTDTSDWDDQAFVWAANTNYSINTIRRPTTPNGGLFIVVTTGLSGSSEPAGFATANDGDTVIDGTVTWRKMWRQKLTLTVTLNNPGWVTALVCVARSNMHVWFDPELHVS